MKKQIVSIAVVFTFTVRVLASAHVEIEKVEENKVVVSYNLQEATTADGRVELARQIRRAAVEVCGPQRVGKAGPFAEFVLNRACFEETLTKEMLKV